ncbi:hypothetical protein [Gemmatimonas sp.]|uniref:hypothetical protein n=1 Tax=Gemmatimonas sp. TaxID=1962908 RepID=UPI00356824B9
MSTADIEITVDAKTIAGILSSPDARQALDELGVAILARAIPYTGQDSGILRASMRTEVRDTDTGIELIGGSNVEYAIDHWAPGKPGGRRAGWAGTRPWTRALADLGITHDEPKGYPV